MITKEITQYNTVAEYNKAQIVDSSILTGKQFRRLKRQNKL